MLESYCSQLEHRVIERFDAAVEAGDEAEQVGSAAAAALWLRMRRPGIAAHQGSGRDPGAAAACKVAPQKFVVAAPPSQAECVRIMIQCDKEKAIAQVRARGRPGLGVCWGWPRPVNRSALGHARARGRRGRSRPVHTFTINTHTPRAQRWVASRAMFLAIDDAMLEEVLVLMPRRRPTADEEGGGGAAAGAGPAAAADYDPQEAQVGWGRG